MHSRSAIQNFIFAIFFFLATESDAQYYLGLIGAGQTTDLSIFNDTIYASTSDGIYKKSILTIDTNWTACGMQGNHVVQTLVKDNQTFICVVEIGTTGTTQIYKSIDGGISFQLLHPGISSVNAYPYLDAIAHPENNFDTLYFLNHRIKTYDGGQTWDTIPAPFLSDRFIAVNFYNHNQLIIGGETMIFSAYLQTSLDRGNTWSMPAMNGYFAGDNSVHDMIFEGNDWYAIGEGVICKSSDGGNNWTQLLNTWSGPAQFSLYNFDIEFGYTPQYMFVTGSNVNAPEVPLIVTGDGGITWHFLSWPTVNSSNPEMRCLAVTPAPFGNDIFLGGNGIYLFHLIIGGMEEMYSAGSISLFPNPCQNEIHVFNPTKRSFSIILYNVYGEQILCSENQESLNLENCAAGVYFAHIIQAAENHVLKLIHQ